MHSDTDILIQQTIANWQWYHWLAVGIGSAVCVVVGVLLVGYRAPWIFSDIWIRITHWREE